MAKHLTPDERQRIVARFVETGNASQVAREFGISDVTVSRCVARAKESKKADLHARACARGMRDGHRAVREELARMRMYIETGVGDGTNPSVEPRDYAALVKALTDLDRTLLSHAAHIDKHQESLLRRKLLREQVAAAREGHTQGDVVVVVRTSGGDPPVDSD